MLDKGCWMVLIHHPLGFNQKLLEDAGIISCFGGSPLVIGHPLFYRSYYSCGLLSYTYLLPFLFFAHRFPVTSQKFGVGPNLRVEYIYIYISSKSSAQQAQPRAIAPETRPFLKRKGSSRSPKHHFSRDFCCWFQELVSAKITQILHGISGTSTVRIMRCHEWKWNYSCSDLLTMFGTTGSYMFFCYLKWSINHIERMNNHQQKNMPPVWAFTISIRDSYSFII